MSRPVVFHRFNPRPREGATLISWFLPTGRSSFNPRPREGATVDQYKGLESGYVSIHAPAKGRRETYAATGGLSIVSIHAPAKGRLGWCKCYCCAIWFQSTPPRRGDRERDTGNVPVESFNPRPREGATIFKHLTRTNLRVSIHAPAKGRHCASVETVSASVFQSTPPRRGDLRCLNPPIHRGCFNPRPREGATSGDSRFCLNWKVSIHAPAKGRPISAALGEVQWVFQSTPPRRGDPVPISISSQSGCFNPRPREGATNYRFQAGSRQMVSIHAPAKGRLTTLPGCFSMRKFQSTPPRRGDSRASTRSIPILCFNPRPREGATHRR